MQEHILQIKQEGNYCFKAQKYDDALRNYFLALRLCQTYSITDESALIRCNCAQACLKLGLYRDAYDHADECVRVNPNLDKVTCLCLRVGRCDVYKANSLHSSYVCTYPVHCKVSRVYSLCYTLQY